MKSVPVALLAAALLHSAIVVEKREALKSWTILLAILAFGFSLIGTFIVRSGVLTSVHAFANDPERGVFILLILAFFMGGALVLYAIRAGVMEAKGVFQPVSREGALVLNNILLAVAAFVVFFGTLWPLVAELMFDRKLSVGPPFFNKAFTPFMTILAMVLPIGAILPWKRGRLERTVKPLAGAFVLVIVTFGLVSALAGGGMLAPVGAALGVWLVAGASVDLLQRSGRGTFAHRVGRILKLPRADWGRTTAHAGLGVTITGIAVLTALTVEDIRVVTEGETWEVGAYELTLIGVDEGKGPNYFTTQAIIEVSRNGVFVGEMKPERRIYPVAGMPTTEAAIKNGFLRDLYLVVGDPQQDGGWAVRTFIKPLANWIWAGAIIMAFGGILSLTDRRYRIAAGAARTRNTVAAE